MTLKKACLTRDSSSLDCIFKTYLRTFWLIVIFKTPITATVEPPCATRPLVSDHRPLATTYPKHQDFPSQSVTVGTSRKRPFPVSDQDHFLCLTVNDFPLFLNSCQLPLEAFSDLYFRCVHYATKNIRRTLVTTWNYRWRNLDIACN